MILIRHNKEKQRSVYFCDTYYRKVWSNIDPAWIKNHVDLLNEVVPGFVLRFGNDWIDYRIIKGIPASELPQTQELLEKIYKFCLEQNEKTKPFYHGDWTLSNIIVDGDTMTMIDWDNLGRYREEEVLNKLHADLKSAFGNLYVL